MNVAARLQTICEPGQVLISHATWLLVKEQIHRASRGDVQFKGVHQSVTVHQVIGAR